MVLSPYTGFEIQKLPACGSLSFILPRAQLNKLTSKNNEGNQPRHVRMLDSTGDER